MDLRAEFVLRAKGPGANIAELCREFGVSRKTGYKWLGRFDTTGLEGLSSMSRRPRRSVGVSGEVVLRINELRALHPKWGPKKLRVLLLRSELAAQAPSAKTIARVLERLGAPLIRRPRRSAGAVVDREAPQLVVGAANDVWTVDFKGWWRARNGERCDPLTVRDAFSRFVHCVKLLASTGIEAVMPVFSDLFQRWGMPRVIHVDNGSPFGCTRARGGLSKLSAWWIAIGIEVSFSRPATPQDNGAHERMHADLQREVADDVAQTRLDQQHACDAWVEQFNHVRPHEALAMKTPAEVYVRSSRPYRSERAFRPRAGLELRMVKQSGDIRWNGLTLFVSASLAGLPVAIERVDERFVRVHFYELDLGLLDVTTTAKGAKLGQRNAGGSPAGSSHRQKMTSQSDVRDEVSNPVTDAKTTTVTTSMQTSKKTRTST